MHGDVVGVRDAHEHAIIERQDHARQHDVVEIDAVLVEDAVALGASCRRDAAHGVELIVAVDVLHVGAHLHDIHAAIAIEDAGHGLLDLRFAEHEFELVALGKLNGFALVRR